MLTQCILVTNTIHHGRVKIVLLYIDSWHLQLVLARNVLQHILLHALLTLSLEDIIIGEKM